MSRYAMMIAVLATILVTMVYVLQQQHRLTSQSPAAEKALQQRLDWLANATLVTQQLLTESRQEAAAQHQQAQERLDAELKATRQTLQEWTRALETMPQPILDVPAAEIPPEVREQLHAMQQAIDAMKMDVLRINAPLKDHQHTLVRRHFILEKARQLAPGGILMLGDSIIESLHLEAVDLECPSMANELRVLNAGIGGIGAGFFDPAYLQWVLDASKPGIVVLALGINDCAVTNPDNEAPVFAKWKPLYRRLVEQLYADGRAVVLCTLLPVEQHKFGDDRLFSDALIEAFNRSIKALAAELDVTVVDGHTHFATGPEDFTVDGVHLSTASALRYKEIIVQGVQPLLGCPQ